VKQESDNERDGKTEWTLGANWIFSKFSNFISKDKVKWNNIYDAVRGATRGFDDLPIAVM